VKKIICKFILWICGWSIIGEIKWPKKCIVIAAPHTSNWDFVIGRCFSYVLDISPKYLVKSEIFLPIISFFIKLNGGIPVYRNSKNDLVNQVVELFNQNENLILAIAPEGTRSFTNRWKTGFYYISLESKVPLLLVKIDYKLKQVGLITEFNPTGDFDKDMLFIQEKYQGISARIPENYNSKIF